MGMSKETTIEEFNKWAAERNIELETERDGFKAGNIVTYTNDFGVAFENTEILGISKEPSSWGACVYLNQGGWWCPVKITNIHKGPAIQKEPKTIVIGNLKLTEAGFDFWCNPLYTDQNGRTYVEVDGVPHTMTSEGEALSPLKSS